MRVAGNPGSKPHPSNQLHPDVGVLISGCCDSETSADSTSPADPSRACGAMTNAVVSVVRDHYYNYPSTPLTNRSACLTLNRTLARKSYCAVKCTYVLATLCAIVLCALFQQLERSLSHVGFQELLLASCMSVLLGRHQRTTKASHAESVLRVTSHWLPAVTVTDSCQVHTT